MENYIVYSRQGILSQERGNSLMSYDPHPMQEIGKDDVGIVRFRENAIIRWMLDQGRLGNKFDLNSMYVIPFSKEDYEQFMQQLGYSLSGYSELANDYYEDDGTKSDDYDTGRVSINSVEKAYDIMYKKFPEFVK